MDDDFDIGQFSSDCQQHRNWRRNQMDDLYDDEYFEDYDELDDFEEYNKNEAYDYIDEADDYYDDYDDEDEYYHDQDLY